MGGSETIVSAQDVNPSEPGKPNHEDNIARFGKKQQFKVRTNS
jgi:hypothetical protein